MQFAFARWQLGELRQIKVKFLAKAILNFASPRPEGRGNLAAFFTPGFLLYIKGF